MIPFARIEAASSSSPSELKDVRGCMGLGWIKPSGSIPGLVAIDVVAGAVAAAVGPGWPRPERRAERPLPSALRGLSSALFICHNLLREFDIALGSPRPRVVHQDRLAVAGRFSEADTPRDYRCKYLIRKELLQVFCYLPRQICAFIVHGEQDSLDLKRLGKGISD